MKKISQPLMDNNFTSSDIFEVNKILKKKKYTFNTIKKSRGV